VVCRCLRLIGGKDTKICYMKFDKYGCGALDHPDAAFLTRKMFFL
jgi:hypothetical protein